MSASIRQGRKGTAQSIVAVGSARPDPRARRVTADMCRAMLQRRDLTDHEAEVLLDHLYIVVDVGIDAFIERRGRTEMNDVCEPLAELGNEVLHPAIHAA